NATCAPRATATTSSSVSGSPTDTGMAARLRVGRLAGKPRPLDSAEGAAEEEMPRMLHGEHVTLRAIEREDLPVLHELLDDDLELMARASDTPARPASLAELEHRFEERLEEPDPRTMRFVIEVDDELIGECELHFIDHFQRTCHLGITLGRAYWSKGFGQDAVRALVDFAFRDLAMRKIGLEVLADDERAVGAYTKAGFVEEGRLRAHAWFDGEIHDTLMMGILREEWASGPHH
ncbi:MAG: GNAT family N-acetyltransferase, partial [Actinomycetota bacterium]|nr:GNAT family N-acetyltransferase [Actinomycetota bacterium]